MKYWSIKEVADMLDITAQAIYKNKDLYINKGYIENIDGKFKINLQGYNYFISRKKKDNNEVAADTGEIAEIKTEYIDMLKSRVTQLEQELKDTKTNYQKELEQERNRTAYFKQLFESKDRLLSSYMLPPGESNKLNREGTEKKGFFARLFDK